MTVGLTLVYGSLRTLNMAQGTFGMMAATSPGSSLRAPVSTPSSGCLPPWRSVRCWASSPFTSRSGLCLGADIDFEMTVYISTLVVAIMLENGATLIWGARDKAIAPIFGGQFRLTGSVTVTWQSLSSPWSRSAVSAS